MSNSEILPNSIIEGIKDILSRSRDYSRPIQHEFLQQELFDFFRLHGFETFFEFEFSYFHKYRNTKNLGKIRLIEFGRIDIYAKKEKNVDIAIEFDSGATLKWKSIEKLLQCQAQYCFGIVGGGKTNSQLKLDMYDEKTLWKYKLVFEEQILYFDAKKQFTDLFNLLNKNIWIGNIKKNSLNLIDPQRILSSKISLQHLSKTQQKMNKIIEEKREHISKKVKLKSDSVIVFKLENNKWYVGKSENIQKFIRNIKTGNGPRWTQINKLNSVHKIIINGDLKEITLEYMKTYGWENVRGYGWSQINMKRPPKVLRIGDLKYARVQKNLMKLYIY